MYTGGTSEAVRFIEKYKKTGHVVDFYSDDHISSLDQDRCSIFVDDLKAYDAKHGAAYRGHMLTVYIGDEDKEMLNELASIYLPFRRLLSLESAFGGWTHKPDLLIVNLITREILCVGLGRKNRCFHFELHRYLGNRTTNNEENKGVRDFDSQTSTDCSEEFFRLDHYGISRTAIKALSELGENYYAYDLLPGNADVMVTLNQEDGLYYFDDFEDAEGMTDHEVKEIQADYENHREWIDDCLSSLREIFPKIDDWELNTGDY
jgi:hypothetical protein